ncbi:MAG: hypothetical protein AAF558_06110, partial [Verrucomicrobiota bacterium]
MSKRYLVQSSSQARTQGFSLVEVAMSLGIFSFAFVSLLGTFPLAVSSLRTAMDTTAHTIIGQQLLSDI